MAFIRRDKRCRDQLNNDGPERQRSRFALRGHTQSSWRHYCGMGYMAVLMSRADSACHGTLTAPQDLLRHIGSFLWQAGIPSKDAGDLFCTKLMIQSLKLTNELRVLRDRLRLTRDFPDSWGHWTNLRKMAELVYYPIDVSAPGSIDNYTDTDDDTD